ncbi:MAG: SOS response-associated peptidase [Actinobacteria bacterium]|nr:SOS response-associated peptidase [Actinomycetota bacterium]MTB27271.1 SOS response-associated peptidase [Actinomycetota bacterium]
MCGRYVAAQDPAALVAEFEVVAPPEQYLPPNYNVAPSTSVYVVVDKRQGDEPPARSLEVAKWGLVPSWAKDPGIGAKMTNARSETVASKPSFKKAFASQRCLVPADGYYEWYTSTEVTSSGRPAKLPFFIHAADGATLAMAGLYEWWRSPEGSWLLTCCVLTKQATQGLIQIHDRMPVMVPQARWNWWLDSALQIEIAPLLDPRLVPLEAYPVSTAVNNARNSGPELMAPIQAR